MEENQNRLILENVKPLLNENYKIWNLLEDARFGRKERQRYRDKGRRRYYRLKAEKEALEQNRQRNGTEETKEE